MPSNIHFTINKIYDLSSDHTPTLLKIGLSPSIPKRETLTPGRMDWSIFKKTLNDNIKLNITLKTTDEVNAALDFLTSSIQLSAALCASITKTNKSPHNKTPHHIQILLAEKSKARAKLPKSKFPNDKIKLNQSNKLKKVIRKHKNDSYNSYVEALSTTNCSLWKATKSLLRLKQPSPLFAKQITLGLSLASKKLTFSVITYRNALLPHDIQPSAPQLDLVDSSLNSPLPMSLPAKNNSPGEIEHIIKQLHTKKSPGHDLISNVITKNLPKKIIIFLSHIFNAIFRLSYFPNTWKYSVVILMPKPNKPPQDPASYRPISLLPTFSKIFRKFR